MPDTITEERTEADLRLSEMPSYGPPAVQQDSVSVIAKTEVITAQRVSLPRDYGRIMQRLKTLAAMSGEDWYYRFPVKNRRENRTDYIEGPSVKCATAVAREYGNCALDCRSVDQGSTTLFLARFVDLETGFQLTRPFQQRKSQQTLRGDADRNADIVYQIGASKATRNVVCNALEMFTNYAFEQAKASLIEKVGKKLDDYRAKVIARLKEMEVDLARVERILGKTAKEWLAPEVARLIAEIQAIHDGMANKNDLYPPIDAAPDEAKPTGSKLDQFSDGGGKGKKTSAAQFTLTTPEGEVRTFDNPNDAAAAFATLIAEASTAGVDAVDGLWESNNLSGQLRDRGFTELADGVQRVYVEAVAELNKQRAAARDQAQATQDAPLPVPPKFDKKAGYAAWKEQITAWIVATHGAAWDAYAKDEAQFLAWVAENRRPDWEAIQQALDDARG